MDAVFEATSQMLTFWMFWRLCIFPLLLLLLLLFFFFFFVRLAYEGKGIVFRFIIEYSSFRDFYWPLGLFSYEDFGKMIILACIET
jgi:hypothetical protein